MRQKCRAPVSLLKHPRLSVVALPSAGPALPGYCRTAPGVGQELQHLPLSSFQPSHQVARLLPDLLGEGIALALLYVEIWRPVERLPPEHF